MRHSIRSRIWICRLIGVPAIVGAVAVAIALRTTPAFHSKIPADLTANAAESHPLLKYYGAMPDLNGGVA
jgi:hypothetical protein